MRYVDIKSACTRSIYAKNAFIRDVELKILVKLEII